MEKGKQSGSGEPGGSGDQKIKVGEKEYSVDDVQNILAQVQTLTKKGDSVQGILDACARYDMEPGEFLDQAMGGLSVISNLIKDGVIDEQGNVKTKVEDSKQKDDLKKMMNLDVDDKSQKKTGNKADEAVIAALEGMKTSFEGYGKKLEKLESIQTSMIHEQYRERIRAKHPNLSDKDADQVLALAMNEGKKDIWGYAEDVSKARVAEVENIEKAFAEKHGLKYEDLKKADENKLKEQGSKGGTGPARPEGKKITFNPKGPNDVTPLEASQEFLRKNLGGD